MSSWWSHEPSLPAFQSQQIDSSRKRVFDVRPPNDLIDRKKAQCIVQLEADQRGSRKGVSVFYEVTKGVSQLEGPIEASKGRQIQRLDVTTRFEQPQANVNVSASITTQLRHLDLNLLLNLLVQ